ncbi:hypothetical protein JTB14_027129 [Gonioctena quinquepunctata]|nr:hypothetical protein JTB14_027129 [Gonioctena quinquepunctata]
MCLCDVKTHYLLNSFVYCEKTREPNPRKLLIPILNVLQLMKPIMHTKRNITGDNSVELVDELRRHELTYVGTVNKKKLHLPPECIPHKTALTEYNLKPEIIDFYNSPSLKLMH